MIILLNLYSLLIGITQLTPFSKDKRFINLINNELEKFLIVKLFNWNN